MLQFDIESKAPCVSTFFQLSEDMETHGAPRSFTQIRHLPFMLILSVLQKREYSRVSIELPEVHRYLPFPHTANGVAFPCKLHRNSNTDKEARSQSIKKLADLFWYHATRSIHYPYLCVYVCVWERERLAREHHRFEGARRPPSEGVFVCMMWRGLLAGRWLLDSTLPGELFHLSFVWTVAWLTYQNSTISFLRVRVTNKIVQL